MPVKMSFFIVSKLFVNRKHKRYQVMTELLYVRLMIAMVEKKISFIVNLCFNGCGFILIDVFIVENLQQSSEVLIIKLKENAINS